MVKLFVIVIEIYISLFIKLGLLRVEYRDEDLKVSLYVS